VTEAKVLELPDPPRCGMTAAAGAAGVAVASASTVGDFAGLTAPQPVMVIAISAAIRMSADLE